MWKKVVGFENEYEVNELGEIKTISISFKSSHPGKILKPTRTKNGYYIVRLWKNAQPYPRYVHRVVAEAFLTASPHARDVNHKDGNKANNRVENLEFVTRAENNLHAYRVLGKKAAVKTGEAHPGSKLTRAAVQAIRAEYPTVKSYAALAKKYSVDWTTIKSVILFRTWKGISNYESSIY